MVIAEQLMTLTEFEAFLVLPENKDRLWELIEGRPFEKMPTQQHGKIVTNSTFELEFCVRKRKKGLVAVEVRHQMPGDNHNSRLPDISFYEDDTQPIITKGAVPRMPDLVVELKSPDDSYREMRTKAEYYLAHGTKMVWLIYPDKRLIEVLTVDDFQFLYDNDILTGGAVLPEFSVAVADIFRMGHEA